MTMAEGILKCSEKAQFHPIIIIIIEHKKWFGTQRKTVLTISGFCGIWILKGRKKKTYWISMVPLLY